MTSNERFNSDVMDVAEECYYEWLSLSKTKQNEVCRINGTTRETFYTKFIRRIIDHAYGRDDVVAQLSLCF